MKLKGKNALVTGGSIGLGAAIVQAYLKEGANVFFCSRNQKEGEGALAGFQNKGQKVFYQRCDVSIQKELEKLFRDAVKKMGSVDILVNNAGIYGPIGPSEEVPMKDWIKALEINLFGLFYACRLAIEHFKKRGRGGKIINLSGGGATNPLPRFSSYAASKAAVVRLTETLAEELREYNIDVNSISPGALNTRLLDQVLQSGPENAGASFYQKALAQASEGGAPLEKGVKLCVYLASDESNGVTGKLISALWDPWEKLHTLGNDLRATDIYCLRRIVPADRGKKW